MPIRKIHVTGIVQGVGFRPFVYQIATRAKLHGWVVNTSAGVEIEIEGDTATLDDFLRALTHDKPPLARIDSINVVDLPTNGHERFDRFEIRESVALAGAFQPISPDISICPDCLRELFDPNDRRYLYPFINCTNCGPRFTIIEDIPYDRPKTTMKTFPMCDDCAREYHDPLNRRFHAQPVACPKCGPKVWLENNSQSQTADYVLRFTHHASRVTNHDAIAATQELLNDGAIVAIKGLGGFHLACDATNANAVSELRRRKLRVDKPFALMMPDLATVEQHCFVDADERALLESHERPIVLLHRRPDSLIADQVAPNNHFLGVMLPYTPLHYLLMNNSPSATSYQLSALVMTSGNLSEEPIASDNDDARERLSSLADAFLMHDRDIRTRCDDSVMRVLSVPLNVRSATENTEITEKTNQLNTENCSLNTVHRSLFTARRDYPLRRSRGYAPFPVHLPFDAPPMLATGAELKNTFCITRDRYAFLSHHIGDLENYETLKSFEDGVAHFERLFRAQPQLIAYDLHPNYLATRYALDRAERERVPAIGVQHHHAHIAACMVENGLSGERSVIGVAFDGTGYGDDGAIWGGEFLIADYRNYRRAFHLDYVPLPGGDKAVREPWRIALAWLHKAKIEWSNDLACVCAADEQTRHVVRNQIERSTNAPLTSSMGRLFDAVAALAGVRETVNYEAQAAIEFENQYSVISNQFSDQEDNYQLPITNSRTIDPIPMIQSVVADVRAGVTIGEISARFHGGVAAMVHDVCVTLREREELNEVALSGGVWQNMTLLAKTIELLQGDGFTVYIHRQVPTNDGGLALGQAAIAAKKFMI
ncbi:MAG: carbamoyltransferase HypF [Chloroflexi bacterium]|nr:carbamoyltransferase HypF [Chloroflexota bacterium]